MVITPEGTEPAPRNLGAELAHHEQVIAENQRDYLATGNALTAIRDQKLYRELESTFQSYCEKRWGISKSRAYQLIDCAQVMADLSAPLSDPGDPSTIVETSGPALEPLPRNEAQVRPLVVIARAQRREVWENVIARAVQQEKAITAELVESVVDSWMRQEEVPRRVVSPRLRDGKKRTPALEVAEEQALKALSAYGEAICNSDSVGQRAALRVVKRAARDLYQAEIADGLEELDDQSHRDEDES